MDTLAIVGGFVAALVALAVSMWGAFGDMG